MLHRGETSSNIDMRCNKGGLIYPMSSLHLSIFTAVQYDEHSCSSWTLRRLYSTITVDSLHFIWDSLRSNTSVVSVCLFLQVILQLSLQLFYSQNFHK